MLGEEELNRIKGLIVNPFDAFKIVMDIGASLIEVCVNSRRNWVLRLSR